MAVTVTAVAGWDTSAATPFPFVRLQIHRALPKTAGPLGPGPIVFYPDAALPDELEPPASWPTDFNVYRDGVLLTAVTAPAALVLTLGYDDLAVTPGVTYTYSVTYMTGAVESAGSAPVTVVVPLNPGVPGPPAPSPPSLSYKWVFTDVYHKGPTPYTYTWEINPNDGGSPTFEKSFTSSPVTGPNIMPLLQEGSNAQSSITFSGVILTQEHFHALETWYTKRILISLRDDLDRVFYGVFSKWAPARQRRAHNAWYHHYDAEFQVISYVAPDGQRIWGRVV